MLFATLFIVVHIIKVISTRVQLSEDASGNLMKTILEGMVAYNSKELSQKILRGREIIASKFLSLGSNFIAKRQSLHEGKEMCSLTSVKIFVPRVQGV